MKKNNLKTTGVFSLSILAVLLLTSCGQADKDETKSMNDKESMSQDYIDDSMMVEGYKDYSDEALANAKGNIVLFFHADWCPSCVAIEKKILSEGLPEDLTVLNVNYDKYSDLKSKYEVLTQTSFVQVDNEGNMIKKWIGARDVEDIVSKLEKVEMMDDKEEVMEYKSEMMDKKEDMMDKEVMEDKMMDDKEEVMKKGMYGEYSMDAVKNASGDIVLFFHADWCPSCVFFDKKAKSEEVPENLTLLKVNYDDSSDLKKKYGVLTQTTFVQVDSEGNMIKKWVGAKSLADVNSKIQ